MTFFCGKTRHGAFKVKRKTSRKTLRQSLAQFTDWIRRYRNLLPTGELLRRAKARVQGHLNYYAITDNSESCQRYMHLTRRALFKWLNRRSQRKSYTWNGLLTSSAACGLAPGTYSRPPQPFCHAERLNEEPDMGKPFVRFCEGLRHNWCMAEILWHRRETRRQTENTNVMPAALEDLSLLDKYSQPSFSQRLLLR